MVFKYVFNIIKEFFYLKLIIIFPDRNKIIKMKKALHYMAIISAIFLIGVIV